MTVRFHTALSEWIVIHPGGQLIFPGISTEGLTSDQLTHYFYGAIERSKWDKVRGFHVFRHSFASNCAAAGIDQRIIDEWLGHQTEEMRRRYRHLFPEQQRAAIQSVFQGNGK
jgi:integrase